MNLPDGSVEACVSLEDDEKLAYFLDILKAGSPYSSVDKIETRRISTKLPNGFTIYR